MQPARGQIVFLDTNVMIELFRIRGWNALAGTFQLTTVEMCCMEAGKGDPARPGYVRVNVTQVRSTARVEPVTPKQKAELLLRVADKVELDPGELELLAHLITRKDAWLVCSPDGACVRAGKILGLLDRYVSLEELLNVSGFHAKLKDNYTRKWMSNFRTRLLLETP